MVDFASIYGIANRPTTALQTPMEAMGQALQLKSAMQQGELQGLNLQQQKQAMADAEAFKQDVAAAGGDPEKLKTAMMKRGKVKEVADITKSQKDAEKAQLDAVRAHHQATTDLNGQQLMTLQAARDAIAAAPDQAQAIWDRTRLQLQKNAEPFAGPLKLDLTKTDDPTMFPGIQFLDQKIAQNKTFEQRLKEQEVALKSGYSGFHAGADQFAYQVNPQGQARQIIGPDGEPLRVPPPQTAITLQQMNSNYDGSTPLPKGMEVIAKAIAAGDQDMMTSARTMPRFADINARAAVLREQAGNGDLPGHTGVAEQKAGKLAFGPKGEQGKTLVSLDTAVGHLAHLKELGVALNNGNAQAVNAASNYFKQQFGGADATNFELVKNFVLPEIIKTAKGSGQITQSEEHALNQLIGSMSSPAQINGFIDQASHIMGSKVQALDPQYKRYFGSGTSVGDRLRPESKALLEGIGVKFGPKKAEADAPAPDPKLPYRGKVMAKAKFDALSKEAKAAFIVGGGEAK